MKANELRIGNCVLFKNKVHIVEIQTLIELEKGNDKFQRIPLNEEWLLKFEFVKMGEKHNFFIHGYQINFKVDKKMKWVAWCNTVLTNVEIKYVHQLQNLYFALVGEELTKKRPNN